MTAPYTYQLRHDGQGRIIEKTETVTGESITWTYDYDKEGRLTEARLNSRLVCQCDYDRDGLRIRDRFPFTAGNSFRNYDYNLMTGRLMRAGDSRFTHDKTGFRSIRNDQGRYTTYEYAPDYRLLSAHQEDEDIRYAFKHDENGQRMAKHRNGQLIEAYLWLDFIRLAGFHDGQDAYEFAYCEGDRLPAAMQNANGTTAFLFYDQVGSLRVVADQSGDVIKEILYDPFGGILEDTNTALRIPLGFAGGLHDRDLGLVRFGWRDYDPTTGRWTAPDPMGDAGGDPNWYGYCLNDPVNMVDPVGLWSFGGMMDSIGDFFGGKKDDERDSLDGLEKGKLPGLDKKIKDGVIGKGDNAGGNNTLEPGGGRFGGGGASGAWDAPDVQPDSAPPSKEKEDQPEETDRHVDMGFFNKAAKMNQARRAKEVEDAAKAKAEQEERSKEYAKGKSDDEEHAKEEVAPQDLIEKTDIKSIAGKQYNSLTTEMANPELLDDGLGWGLDTTLANALSLGVTLGIEQAKRRATGIAAKGLLGSLGVFTAPFADWLSPSSTNIGHDEMLKEESNNQKQ